MQNKNNFTDVFVPKMEKAMAAAVDWVSVVLLTGIFILGLAQVFWRWILNHPIVWSEEMIRLTYVWICYLGWVIAERKDTQIRITVLMNILPKEVQKWVQIFCHILTIVFSILMVYYGIRLTAVGAKRTAVSFALNYGFVYVMAPVCNFIIIMYEIAATVNCFVNGPKDYRDKGGDEQ